MEVLSCMNTHTTATTNGRFLDGLLFGGTKHFTKNNNNTNPDRKNQTSKIKQKDYLTL